MRVTQYIRIANNPTVDALRKRISQSIAEAPNYINTVRAKQTEILYNKFSSLNNWYTRILGLDEVRSCQDKVSALQEQLLLTQEKRRDIARQLVDVRQKSNELQDELHKVKRSEDLERYLDLMKKETEVLKMEHSISRTFQEYDQAERELFSAFSNAIRDSHEKQRSQVEYTKYFGLVLSIAGSFLAFCYTTLRKHDIKVLIDSNMAVIQTSIQDIGDKIDNHENVMNHFGGVLKEIKSSHSESVVNDVLHVVKIPDENNDGKDKSVVRNILVGVLLGLVLSKMVSS